MKVLFFGTPAVAVPFLEWLVAHEQVVGVVCRPDEPVGRGYEVTPPPTKVFALEKKIPVFQPEGPWQAATIQKLKDTGADVGIVVAYGRIMPREVYSAPRLGSLNIHFSLLPDYRGAAPMQWALINGETKTGVSAFWLDDKMDTGPLFHQEAISIDAADNVVSLKQKLIPVGLNVLARVAKDLSANKPVRTAQAKSDKHAPQIKKELGRLDWNKPAAQIVNLVRGLIEWPGVSTTFKSSEGQSKHLKVMKAVAENGRGSASPGEIIEARKDMGIVVQTGDGRLVLLEVQPEGKKAMPAWAYWQGARLKIGDKFI